MLSDPRTPVSGRIRNSVYMAPGRLRSGAFFMSACFIQVDDGGRVCGCVCSGGGGRRVPQWNCGCPRCRAVRDGSRPCRSRTQSSVAVSVDYRRWFLLNASPDIRTQIESFPPLHP